MTRWLMMVKSESRCKKKPIKETAGAQQEQWQMTTAIWKSKKCQTGKKTENLDWKPKTVPNMGLVIQKLHAQMRLETTLRLSP